MENRVIASLFLSGRGALNIYEVDSDEECIIVGLNDDKPKKYKLYWNEDCEYYFNYDKTRYYLHQFIKVG